MLNKILKYLIKLCVKRNKCQFFQQKTLLLAFSLYNPGGKIL